VFDFRFFIPSKLRAKFKDKMNADELLASFEREMLLRMVVPQGN